MRLADLRRKPLSDFHRNDADGYAQQAELRVVFDEHANCLGSPDRVAAARDAMAYLLELYGYARGIDESLQPQQGQWALGWHIPCLLGGILDYADSYGTGIQPGQVRVQDWVRLGTDDSVRDFREAFEGFCSARRGAEAHLLLCRCAASFCRVFEDRCWTHLVEFDEPSRMEIHPVATLDEIARVTAMPVDREGCDGVLKAFGRTEPDADAAASLQAIAELYAAADAVIGMFAGSGWPDETLAAFSDFCKMIRQKSTVAFGLYNTMTAVLAMRAWCNLVLDRRCKLLGPIMAWMHHCLRLHCEWKITGMNQ